MAHVVQTVELAAPPAPSVEQRRSAVMRFLRRQPLGAAGAVLVAALLWPATLGPAPVQGLFVSRPHWPFLWLTPLQERLGPWSLMALPALVAAAAALAWWPPRALALRRSLVLILALGLALLTLLGGRA
jgi:hypothetical protein